MDTSVGFNVVRNSYKKTKVWSLFSVDHMLSRVSKTQNDYLLFFTEHKASIAKTMLNQYAHPGHIECAICKTCPAIFRCRTCHGPRVCCWACIRADHWHHPFHRIEQWNGRFFERAHLWQLGIRIVVRNVDECTCLIDCVRHIREEECQADDIFHASVADIFSMQNDTRQTPGCSSSHPPTAGADKGSATVLGHPAQEMHGQPNSVPASVLPISTTSVPSSHGASARSSELAPESPPLDMDVDLEHLDFSTEWLDARPPDESVQRPRQMSDVTDLPTIVGSCGAGTIPETVHAPEVSSAPGTELAQSVEGSDCETDDEHGDPGDAAWEDIAPETEDNVGGGVPLQDPQGNKYVTIVDSSGIHHLPLMLCKCDDNSDLRLHDCIAEGLFPSSFSIISTLFTRACLDNLRLLNLAAKTTPYQYHQFLRRQTNRAFPHSVPKRYNELLCASRQYRILIRENLGATYMPFREAPLSHPTDDTQQDGHETAQPLLTGMSETTGAGPLRDDTPEDAGTQPTSTTGDRSSSHVAPPPQIGMRQVAYPNLPYKLAMFCPSCPQLGVNIPVDFITREGKCVCCRKPGR